MPPWYVSTSSSLLVGGVETSGPAWIGRRKSLGRGAGRQSRSQTAVSSTASRAGDRSRGVAIEQDPRDGRSGERMRIERHLDRLAQLLGRVGGRSQWIPSFVGGRAGRRGVQPGPLRTGVQAGVSCRELSCVQARYCWVSVASRQGFGLA